MKRAVICVSNPQNYIDQFDGYSLMIVNPDLSEARKNYLFERADWSVKITNNYVEHRDGGDYGNEKLFWYTSGTTGDSKFCSFSQTQLDIMADTICKSYNIDANDRYVSVMPLWHAHGQGFFWATKKAGCQTTFVAPKNIRTMSDYSPTFVTAIPEILKVIGQLDLKTLRFVRSASSPLSKKLFVELKNKFNVPVIEAFGMTEALSHCIGNPLHGEQRMGTVGLSDGVQADIVEGELFLQGPTMFQTGWYGTGDLADRDEKGYFRILGRRRDQINVKGVKINPVSLEQQLLAKVNDIGECVIFGSDSVKCIYTGSCSSKTIENFLIGLESYCRPKMIWQMNTIPISPAGKISRSWLDREFK